MKRTLFLLSCLAISANAHAQITQNVLLEPGWNSVYLEVQPEDNEITSVFAGVPLVSIWRFFDADGVTGVPENPSDGLAQLDGWHAFYFPEDSPQAAFSDLFTVRANNAYLINLGGTGNVTVEITGMPVVEERRWAPDAFTFTGFSVEPLIPPTFSTWFSGSTSHLNQPIYRLNDNDEWELVNPGARIEPGVAYWVFSRGASEYAGPLEVMLDPGFRDLDFGKDIPQTGVTLINRAQTTQDIRVARASGGQRVPLEYRDTSDPQAQFPPWVPFEQAFPARLTPGGSTRLVVAPRREDLQFNRAEQVLIFSNLDGARVRIPTAAELPVYDVSLPADVRTVLERLTVGVSFGLGGVATTPLECVGLAGYVPRLLFWMGLPAVLTVIILVGVGVARCLKKKKVTKLHGPVRKSDDDAHGQMVSLDEGAPEGPEVGSTLIESALPPFLQVMFLLYPLVTNVAFVSSQALEPQSLLVL